MVREQRVGATKDELVDELAELHPLGLAARAVLIGRVGLAPTQDGVLVVLVEVLLGAEQPGVGKVHHRVELVEVLRHARCRSTDL